MSGPGIKFGVSGGLQLGPLSSQNVSSNSSSKPMLLSGQQPSAQLTVSLELYACYILRMLML